MYKAFCVVLVYSMRSCVLFNVLLAYCLLFVYLVVYVTYIVLTLPPGGQPICSSVIIINNNNLFRNVGLHADYMALYSRR
jgi:hypothetical protein